jgi:hypothetical protein
MIKANVSAAPHTYQEPETTDSTRENPEGTQIKESMLGGS